MKNILKIFFSILGWTLGIVIVSGGLYLLANHLDLPRSVAFAAAALIFALLLGIALARRVFIRHRRRLQIQKIVTLDYDSVQSDAPNQRLLDNRWNRAVSIMRESYLGRWGNPLYALPWYMVIGKTGAGKSSSIGHSGLNAMQTDLGPEDGGVNTRNCDWHFFRDAVVMDTAGRYAVPLNEAEDSVEWREFLTKLARYRRREPLNGLVVAVAADSLYGEGEHLLSEARCLRRRIDEIMRTLGASFPVYLMVTKIDLLAGMARVLESLPEAAKKHSVGILIQSPEKKNLLPVDAQIGNALQALGERLKSFCLYAGNPDGDAPTPHRILAWAELQAMMPALRAYAEEVFASNPYQESPLLRGIFLSSALRGRQEDSRAFPALRELGRRILRIRENAGGVFLHGFYGSVLPADRSLHRPIAEYLRWRSSVRTVAYGMMLLATFGLSLLFALAYQDNAGLLDRLSYSRSVPADTGTIWHLLEFERLFRSQEQLEREINRGILPSMGFDHAMTALHKRDYAINTSFYQHFFGPAMDNLRERRSRLTADTDDVEFFILMSDLVWRYDLAKAVDQGKSFEEALEIPAMPQGILQALGLGDSPQAAPSVAYSVARGIYLALRRDPDYRKQSLRNLSTGLAQLPEIKSHSFKWIVHRATMLSTLAPIRGDAFWIGHQSSLLREVMLDPLYTKESLAVILDYLDNLNLLLTDVAGDVLKPSTEGFLRWYATEYYRAWQQFALDFAEKAATLAHLPARDEAISLMSTDNDPYFTLLLRMDDELQAIRGYLDPAPAWMEDLALFADSLRLLANSQSARTTLPLPQRLKAGVRDLYGDLSGMVDSQARARDEKARMLAKDVQAYLDALRDLVPFTMSNDSAFKAVKEAMPNENNQQAMQAPLTLAITATQIMNARLNPNPAQDSPVYALTRGPMDFFKQRLMNGAACQIQFMWEGNVLARAGRLAPSQLQQNLFAAQGGIVRDFADNTLEYILHHTLSGYAPEELAGSSIPFTEDFLAFLNSGIDGYRPMRDEYGVTFAALPTGVNDGATEKPYAVELTLNCTREKQTLVNFNSPASTRFIWRPDSCGDTALTIHFRNITLNVLYVGENGFINFLNDFQYGSKVFRASDFPDQRAMLDKLGVTDITLRYRISGAEELLSAHRFAPGELPFVATECRR
jgi:type VI secretion system protein ImpL